MNKPMETPGKRRLSEIQSAIRSPPSKRRTSFFLASTSRLSTSAIDLNNDEEERLELRKEKEFTDLEKRRDSLKSPAIEISKKIASMYSQVIKLSMENKITQKNTWNLNLIDHMKDILIPTGGHEETNFQKASCTLDASVKIYGCRVDDTLVTSFRVLENLSRDKIEKEQEEVIEQHTSKKIGVTNTIETNMNAICMEKYDLQFDVDPLFHKMSQKFDEGGIKGMLLNNLHIHNGCHIIFDSSGDVSDAPLPVDIKKEEPSSTTEPETNHKDENENPQMIDMSQISTVLPLSTIQWETIPLCPKISALYEEIDAFNQSIYQPQSSSEDEDNRDEPMTDRMEELQLQDISIDNVLAILENPDLDLPFVEGQNNEMELESNDMDSLENTNKQSLSNQQQSTNQNVFSSIAMIEEQVMSSDPSLFTFVPEKLLNSLWNGPKHWKLSQNRTNERSKPSTSRSKNEPHYIDFYSIEGLINPRAEFRKPAHEAEICILNKSEDDTLFTLPEDQHIISNTFISLFLRPEIQLRRTTSTQFLPKPEPMESNEEAEEIEAPPPIQVEVGDYVYENQLDNTYVSDLQFTNDNDDNDEELNEIPLTAPSQDLSNDSSNKMQLGTLLSNGRRQFDTAINYATKAKRVNVQKLKKTMWSCIDREMEKNVEDHGTTFNDTINTLKNDLDREVTGPFYFICLLHISFVYDLLSEYSLIYYLANEHNLRLENNNSELTDIVIKQEPLDPAHVIEEESL